MVELVILALIAAMAGLTMQAMSGPKPDERAVRVRIDDDGEEARRRRDR